jgi:hypothetical protein
MGSTADSNNVIALFSACDRQAHLARVVGGLPWRIDVSVGIISFGERYSWRYQILGTASDVTSSWLWAWANNSSDFPSRLLEASLSLKAYGERQGCPDLVTPRLPLTRFDIYTLGLHASSIYEANGFFRCPYEGGEMCVLIVDDDFPTCDHSGLRRIADAFPLLLERFDISNHRFAFSECLSFLGLTFELCCDSVVVGPSNDPSLVAAFDPEDRLVEMSVVLGAMS